MFDLKTAILLLIVVVVLSKNNAKIQVGSFSVGTKSEGDLKTVFDRVNSESGVDVLRLRVNKALLNANYPSNLNLGTSPTFGDGPTQIDYI